MHLKLLSAKLVAILSWERLDKVSVLGNISSGLWLNAIAILRHHMNISIFINTLQIFHKPSLGLNPYQIPMYSWNWSLSHCWQVMLCSSLQCLEISAWDFMIEYLFSKITNIPTRSIFFTQYILGTTLGAVCMQQLCRGCCSCLVQISEMNWGPFN